MGKDTNNKRIIILICGLVCSLIMGFCYTYSIIQPYIIKYFGIESSQASLPYTIFLAVFVVGNYVGGMMQKKYNVKIIMLIGYLLMAIGIFATSLLPSNMPVGMWFTYGGLLGVGDGMVYNVIVAMMQKWFPDKKGLATGTTLAVLGVSATILSPLCNSWLIDYGFTGMFKILAIIYVIVAIFGMMTIKAPPEGYMADYKPTGAVAVAARQCSTASECFHTKEYYMLTLIYFCAIPAFVLLSAIFVSYGTSRGLDTALAVTGVSVASMMQVAGRFLISAGSDKIGRKGAMILCFVITIAAVVSLTFSTGMLYVICFWLLSFTYGGTAATMPSLITDYLGTKNAGLVCSLVMIGFGISSIGTSFLAKAVSISTTFVVAGAVAIIGIIVTLLLPKLGKETA
jgi:OFA family oxalate/formate antiporter-like MFS transporter